MKNIFIATVGEEMEPILEGFRHVKEVDEVYLICSEKTREYAEEIEGKIKAIYRKVTIIETSPNNISKILEDLINYIEISQDIKIIGNITGGTKIMILALYLFVSVCKGNVFYIFKTSDNKMKYVELPTIGTFQNNILKGTRMKIAKLLLHNPMTQREISKLLGYKDSTVKLHLEKMIQNNIIKINYEGKTKKVMLTPYGELLLILNQIEEKLKSFH